LKELNGSEIKAKDRQDCEKYYLRACGQQKVNSLSDNSFDQQQFLREHPRYDALVQLYGDPCETLKRQSNAAAAKLITVDVLLKCMAPSGLTSKTKSAEVKRKLPATATIFQVKQLCSKLFGVDIAVQKLYAQADKDQLMPEYLDDDSKVITYYDIMDGYTIIIQEVDLEQERLQAEQKEREHIERLIKQEQKAAQQNNMRKNNMF